MVCSNLGGKKAGSGYKSVEKGSVMMVSRGKKGSSRKRELKKKFQKEMVPSRIELLILALLAPRLNQLGQGTMYRGYKRSTLL